MGNGRMNYKTFSYFISPLSALVDLLIFNYVYFCATLHHLHCLGVISCMSELLFI